MSKSLILIVIAIGNYDNKINKQEGINMVNGTETVVTSKEYIAKNMKALKEMVDECDGFYATKVAYIALELGKDLAEGNIPFDLYLHHNKELNDLITKFGKECRCVKEHK